MSQVAYLVLAHADPVQLHRLVGRLAPYAAVFIHLDAKAKREDFACTEALSNVVFVEDRRSVSWAGISMVDAMLATMRTALGSGKRFSKLVFLSGACYPISDIERINAWFEREPSREIIRWIDMRESPHYLKQLSKRWFKEPLLEFTHPKFRTLEKTLRYGLRKLPLQNPSPWEPQMIPCFGSQWWALTHDCCRYIVDFVDNNPWYREMNASTFSPDEHFFHTLVANSPFAANADGLQKFQYVSTWYLANFHLIDPGLSKWFSLEDWDLVAGSDKLFVRKVRSGVSDALCDRLDQMAITSLERI